MNLESFRDKKIAFVLSGGVVRAAAWHLGVGMALEELGFRFKNNHSKPSPFEISTFVGSSAGAFVAAMLAGGFNSRDIIRSTLGIGDKNENIRPISYKDMFVLSKGTLTPPKPDLYHPMDHFPFFIRSILKPISSISGFFTTKGVQNYLEKEVFKESTSFDDLKADLFITTTMLDYSRKVIFGKYNYPHAAHDKTAYYRTGVSIPEAAAASMSVPPFYKPFPIKDPNSNKVEYYIDGEIRETLSTHIGDDNGCNIIISSWTHTPYHYQDEIGSLINYGLPYIGIQAIYLMIQKKIVTSRANKAMAKDIISTVNEYLKAEKFSEKHRRHLVNILEHKLHYKRDIQYIDLYPDHHDYKIFFANAFTLNKKTNTHIVKAGYKKTLKVFEELEL